MKFCLCNISLTALFLAGCVVGLSGKKFSHLLNDDHLDTADGLCCQLGAPFAKAAPTTTTIAPDVWEIDRNELQLDKRLGAGMFGEVWKG